MVPLPRSSPLLTGGVLVGLASSVYWTFGVEHLQRPGGLSAAQSQIVLAVVGVASVGGTAAGDAIRRIGAGRAYVLAAALEATALLLVGLAPGTPATGLTSAILFGFAYNTIVAIQVIWSARVFAERPSAGLAAVMVMNALGLLAGAPVFGAIADEDRSRGRLRRRRGGPARHRRAHAARAARGGVAVSRARRPGTPPGSCSTYARTAATPTLWPCGSASTPNVTPGTSCAGWTIAPPSSSARASVAATSSTPTKNSTSSSAP
jgi:hypothetical protein